MCTLAGFGDETKPLIVDNQYHDLRIGLNMFMNGKYKPMYITPKQVLAQSHVEMIPEEIVGVFFHQEFVGNVITTAVANMATVDFTRNNEQTVRYVIDARGVHHWEMVNTTVLRAVRLEPAK